ncbi:zinc ABC transporter ATP-binding protein ZnuC [Oceanibacterium hippocampi]|uniref:Zinc import ATP-binding protein ZnuC n=1 Tax=Oceanibacterium hippocampi TaxID=745714 RepID=A0A1Y5TA41_9PROT|nr:zinc ABC transporter ATP-binding protein ZnuC [Oceanibacterium hippocampi]SLN59083.1 Zinc import ATP-binding protein ZnuC [Oceanibacterium hippocampi]
MNAVTDPSGDAGPPGERLIAAEGLEVAFGGRRVLEHVDITVSAGEIVTVIGPNGSGKSTLVRTLLGLQPLSAGHVWRKPGLTIGYVPQKLQVDAIMPLTVTRFLTLTGRHDRATVERALAETGVGHLADAQFHVLSGGEHQRVLLARALLRSPDLLVLDEPVQGVDFTGEAALYELIGVIARRHRCGILMVSHDLHVVMAATDRVVCLNHHICCAGTPEAVTHHPEYRRLFGARAAGALALYSHHHDHHHHTVSGAVVTPETNRPEPPHA